MKLQMPVTHAAAIAAAMEAAVMAASAEDDAIFYDGVQLVPYAGAQRIASGDRWALTRPTAFTAVRAEAMSSTITLSKEGANWRLFFEGSRGSLSQHWGRVKALLQAEEAAGAAVEDYQSSIPGMLPWEGLADWYRRVTGAAEGPNPFDPFAGPGTRQGEAWEKFNSQFFAAITEMAAKGTLAADTIRCRRNHVVAAVKRELRIAA